MAAMGEAVLAERVLSRLRVKAAGTAASSHDTNLAKEALASSLDQLKKDGLAPFDLTAVPEWAQRPLIDHAAGQIAGDFGVTLTAGRDNETVMRLAEVRLEEQMAERDQPQVETEGVWY